LGNVPGRASDERLRDAPGSDRAIWRPLLATLGERTSMAASRPAEDEETAAMQLPAGRSSPSHARLTRSCRGPGRPVGELDLATVGIVDAELADL
jgi:hypothetical protein